MTTKPSVVGLVLMFFLKSVEDSVAVVKGRILETWVWSFRDSFPQNLHGNSSVVDPNTASHQGIGPYNLTQLTGLYPLTFLTGCCCS